MFQKIAKHRANDASNDVHRPPLGLCGVNASGCFCEYSLSDNNTHMTLVLLPHFNHAYRCYLTSCRINIFSILARFIQALGSFNVTSLIPKFHITPFILHFCERRLEAVWSSYELHLSRPGREASMQKVT